VVGDTEDRVILDSFIIISFCHYVSLSRNLHIELYKIRKKKPTHLGEERNEFETTRVQVPVRTRREFDNHKDTRRSRKRKWFRKTDRKILLYELVEKRDDTENDQDHLSPSRSSNSCIDCSVRRFLCSSSLFFACHQIYITGFDFS
jgi:hypothetical protein